jgi:pimeloyl-ACP methyl ester carboxylesterase
VAREYVLVHGAAHGAWCWEEVARRLRAEGHRVVALDLPGHGRRAAEVRRAGIAAYGEAVAQHMAAEGVSRGVVVGHSMGGIVISKAAELVPQRIAHLVYLAAVALYDGERLVQVQAPHARALLTGLAAGRGDGTFLYPAETAWARWMGDLRRDRGEAGAALAALTPQALRPFVEPAPLPRFWSLGIPRTYIRCLRDAAITPDRAAMFAARLGVAPVDLDAAHDPMLSAPEPLARILARIPA